MKSFEHSKSAAGGQANAVQRVSQPAKTIVDNRPQAIAQRKLQQAANTSSASVAAGVIQRQIWAWNASTKSWEPSGSKKTTKKPPAYLGKGKYDGQLADDKLYRQKTDPTVIPFLRNGESYMGERGSDTQLSGGKARAADIRVTAVKSTDLISGSGLHEILPTNLSQKIGKSDNEALIGAQSGARTSTAKQTFVNEDGEVGVHTGYAPKPGGGRGFTHTRGQAPAHDVLRETVYELMDEDETNPDIVANEMMLSHLKTTPTGIDILGSEYLEGMQPNNTNLGLVGPVRTGTPDPVRLHLAQQVHEEREQVKRRVRAHKRSKNRGRSPSPPRRPIRDSGRGGAYRSKPSRRHEIEPTPYFRHKSDYQYAADLTAYMTQPMRFED